MVEFALEAKTAKDALREAEQVVGGDCNVRLCVSEDNVPVPINK